VFYEYVPAESPEVATEEWVSIIRHGLANIVQRKPHILQGNISFTRAAQNVGFGEIIERQQPQPLIRQM
jgi:hypothetical protein